jgi:hypothetical protein
MQVRVRNLDLPEDRDLLWQSFNTLIPREREGIIIYDKNNRAVARSYEVARVTYELGVWHEKDGSLDVVTIWVKGIKV